MRSLIFIYLALFASPILYAGDTPCGASLLNTDNPDFVLFNNSTNSDSGIESPPYGGYFGPDTWISFVMPNGGFYLIMNGTTMIDPAIAIYSGPCSDPKLLYNVLDNNCDGNPNPLLFIDQLTPGELYFIRVWAQDGSPNGAFEIKMVHTISSIPDFLAFADATIVGDCIELTQNTGNQQGCAWYQNAIDFTMPFTHEMTANFGTIDAGGADGICLVYQSNGQDFCGGTGEGIGAGGMPNSAIFEFDTWQNGNLNDPAQDHCAFNTNGNMNHNSSIEGPITLGNIEDGLDHTILFEWNPAGNLYSLYFDGLLVLNGSYDIINNCFGGSTSAFWGYTSATGGSSNLQVICPVVEIIQPSFTVYNEVDICQGESYIGHFESGFYVDFIPGSNGCQYQLNTLVQVHEIPEPEYLYDVVCEGEYILVANEVFTLPDLYEINTYTEFGCDSTIYLQLENVIPTIGVEIPQIINCINTSVQLLPIPGSNFPINSVNYTWSGGSSSTNQEIISTDSPGTYYLTALINSNGLQCIASTSVTVEIDTVIPILVHHSDVFLDCTNFDTDTLLFVSDLGSNIVPTWIYGDSIVGNTDTINIIDEGLYSVIVVDTINGCSNSDSFSITMSNDIPNIELNAEKLNCQNTDIVPYFTATGDIDTILWSFNDQFFSYDSLPSISMAGDYKVHVKSKDGCESSASIRIEIDTMKPDIVLYDSIVPCDIQVLELIANVNPDLLLEWSGPNNYMNASQIITVSEDGWYHLSVTDPANYCISSDSSFIQFKGPSPILTLINDTINCFNPTTSLEPTSDQTDLFYSWTYQSESYSEDQDIEVSSDGWYFVEASNLNGCKTMDSVYIHSDFTFPEIMVDFDTLNCKNTIATINTNLINGEIVAWDGPNAFQSLEASFTTSSSGIFFLSTINSNSGCTTFDTIEIINTAIIPEFEIFSDTLNCISTDISLPFSIVTPYLELLWSGPANFSSDVLTPTVSMAGEYTIHLEFEGECSLDTSLLISQDIDAPSFLIEYDSITCLSPQVSINTTFLDPYFSYLLTTPDGSSTSASTYSGIDSGYYYLYLEGINGCISRDTLHIASFLEKPMVSLSEFDSLTCINPQINISALSNQDNLTFNWTGPNNFSSETKDINVTEEGTYTLITLNEYGCTDEQEFSIKSYMESPEVSLEGSDIFCNKLKSTLYYHSSDQISTVTWQSQNNFINLNDSIIVDEAGWYTIQVENEYGCITEDAIFIDAFIDSPEVILLSGDTITVNVDQPNSQILIDVNSNSDYEINWFPIDGLSCFTCLDPFITELGSSLYEVEIINEYGCITSEFVHVKYKQNLRVDIPNVFSPGTKDDNNDFFTIYGNEHVAIVNNMMIYDRWGSLVAQKENFQPNIPSLGWDGYISGNLGQSAVYVYIFEITTTDGFPLTYYGTITLL